MKYGLNKIVDLGKDFILRHSKIILVLTFAMIIIDCNSTCSYLLGQPELPDNCKEFRKYD